jgi:hypothetical protein
MERVGERCVVTVVIGIACSVLALLHDLFRNCLP